jgi:hypothetical protein
MHDIFSRLHLHHADPQLITMSLMTGRRNRTAADAIKLPHNVRSPLQLEMPNSRRDRYLVRNLRITDLVFIATPDILPTSEFGNIPCPSAWSCLEEARRIQKLVDIVGF